MDIKIITLHSICNPGSVFQAFALQKYLGREHQVEIIDYRPVYSRMSSSLIKTILRNILFSAARRRETKKYDNFIKANMNLTKRCKSFYELCDEKMSADCFIAGSDQLWNTSYPCGNDDAYYLKFVKDGRKISYSTSVGKKNIDDVNMSKLKKELVCFDALAVREKDTSIQLSAALNRDVQWVCDPVFLLEKDVYLKFIGTKPIIDGSYALVYLSPKCENLNRIVEYCSKKGLKIVLGGGYSKRCNCDVFLHDMGPMDFLNLIYYSKLVVSTSFHATAFCHIFHKDFITTLPQSNGERIVSLLELTGLMSRSLSQNQIFDQTALDNAIDWKCVDSRIYDYVNESKKFLKENVG